LCDATELREVERIAAHDDIEITALSPGLFKTTDTPEAFHRDLHEIYPPAAERPHRWRLPGLIVFGFHNPGVTEENAAALPREPVPNQIVDWLAEADERAAADGLVLMIEPEPVCCDAPRFVPAGEGHDRLPRAFSALRRGGYHCLRWPGPDLARTA